MQEASGVVRKPRQASTVVGKPRWWLGRTSGVCNFVHESFGGVLGHQRGHDDIKDA